MPPKRFGRRGGGHRPEMKISLDGDRQNDIKPDVCLGPGLFPGDDTVSIKFEAPADAMTTGFCHTNTLHGTNSRLHLWEPVTGGRGSFYALRRTSSLDESPMASHSSMSELDSIASPNASEETAAMPQTFTSSSGSGGGTRGGSSMMFTQSSSFFAGPSTPSAGAAVASAVPIVGSPGTARGGGHPLGTSAQLSKTIRLDELERLDKLGSGAQGIVYRVFVRSSVNDEETPQFAVKDCELEFHDEKILKSLFMELSVAVEQQRQPWRKDSRLVTTHEVYFDAVPIVDPATKPTTFVGGVPAVAQKEEPGGRRSSPLPDGSELAPGTPHAYRAYFRQELLGPSLSKAMKVYGSRRLPTEVAAMIGRCVLDGLEELHRRSIIHGDIWPPNIVFDEDCGCVKLVDFGCAIRIPPDATCAPDNGLGNDKYIAPERSSTLRSHIATRPGEELAPGVSPAADIFSLGMVLLELITGSYPLPDQTEAAESVAATYYGATSDADGMGDPQQSVSFNTAVNREASWHLDGMRWGDMRRLQLHTAARNNPIIAQVPECSKALEAMLNPDPSRRLSARELKKMRFFSHHSCSSQRLKKDFGEMFETKRLSEVERALTKSLTFGSVDDFDKSADDAASGFQSSPSPHLSSERGMMRRAFSANDVTSYGPGSAETTPRGHHHHHRHNHHHRSGSQIRSESTLLDSPRTAQPSSRPHFQAAPAKEKPLRFVKKQTHVGKVHRSLRKH